MLVVPEETTMEPGEVLADRLARLACHLPLLFATADTFWFANCTVTVAPGVAVPNTGTVVPSCRTMFVPKIGATVSAASAGVERKVLRDSAAKTPALRVHLDRLLFFISICGLSVSVCLTVRRADREREPADPVILRGANSGQRTMTDGCTRAFMRDVNESNHS